MPVCIGPVAKGSLPEGRGKRATTEQQRALISLKKYFLDSISPFLICVQTESLPLSPSFLWLQYISLTLSLLSGRAFALLANVRTVGLPYLYVLVGFDRQLARFGKQERKREWVCVWKRRSAARERRTVAACESRLAVWRVSLFHYLSLALSLFSPNVRLRLSSASLRVRQSENDFKTCRLSSVAKWQQQQSQNTLQQNRKAINKAQSIRNCIWQ